MKTHSGFRDFVDSLDTKGVMLGERILVGGAAKPKTECEVSAIVYRVEGILYELRDGNGSAVNARKVLQGREWRLVAGQRPYGAR